ncbi:hypothetical protein EYF80_039420 [Liparis tanakae]|uniref:Uncharacterized protein n=1 Tax=Liparis tanakae TaxID=230148 RepID=A0A4Z2GBF4_9TELE|nr:hypothetical protein EYF80_039420 [Liparis tanakae]
MVDGPHRLYSWTQATVTQSDLAGLDHTSSCPTYEEPGQKVLKPRPGAKNRSTLVAHRKLRLSEKWYKWAYEKCS